MSAFEGIAVLCLLVLATLLLAPAAMQHDRGEGVKASGWVFVSLSILAYIGSVLLMVVSSS